MHYVLLIQSIFLLLSVCVAYTTGLSFMRKQYQKQLYKQAFHDKKLLSKQHLLYKNVSENWIEQKLDNFISTDQIMWKQRFFVQSGFSKDSGPVFLNIGGEGPIGIHWMTQGHWIDMAKKVNAMCFQLEHRYYGLSKPTVDVRLGNLAYLSSEQALADISNFIVNATTQFGLKGRKWIVFGGSYSGALAVWAMLKYPHLVVGAVSASAPLNALVDFSDYMGVVNASLSTLGSSTCAENIGSASKYLNSLLDDKKSRKYLSELFRLCEPLTADDDIYFQESLADNVADVVQYNRDNRAFERVTSNFTIADLCKVMDDVSSGDVIHRYAKLNSLALERSGLKCMDASFSKYLKSMRNSSWDAAPGAREWVYQTCTEFGWFQSSSNLFSGFPVDFFLNQCEWIYSVTPAHVYDAVIRSNIHYGGLQVLVHNVTLYNGIIDPWSSVSYVGGATAEGIIPEVVPDTAHCAIMYPPKTDDSASLVAARKSVEQQLFKWLGLNTVR